MKKGFEKWDYLTIEDYTEIVTDYVANGSFASLKENVKIGKEEDYALMVKTADFANGFSKGLTYTDIHGYEYLAKSKLYGGELLLSNIGSVGKVFRVPYFNRPMTLASNSIMLRCKNELDYQWAYYFFQSPIGRQKLEQICTGTTMKKFNKTGLRAVELPICSDDKRKDIICKIEEMLSALDNAVETLNKTKKQLEVYRQAVLREAFDQSDSFDIVELQDIVADIRIGPFGTMLHKSDYVEDGIPIINPQHIKNQAIIPSKRVSISLEKAEELRSYRLKKNDVIMGRRGEMGRTAAVGIDEEDWICGTGSIIIRLKPEYDAVFLSQILASPDIVHYLEEKSTGTTMNNLNEDIVKHIPVPNITAEEQKKIKVTLDAKVSVCENIEQTVATALAQAEVMRQSILKEAFEGRLA